MQRYAIGGERIEERDEKKATAPPVENIYDSAGDRRGDTGMA